MVAFEGMREKGKKEQELGVGWRKENQQCRVLKGVGSLGKSWLSFVPTSRHSRALKLTYFGITSLGKRRILLI